MESILIGLDVQGQLLVGSCAGANIDLTKYGGDDDAVEQPSLRAFTSSTYEGTLGQV